MLSLGSTVLSTLLLVGSGPSEPGPLSETPAVPENDGAAVAQAEKAWAAARWTDVREILEPLARDPARLRDPLLREKALTYLADATINDDTLDADDGRKRAADYLRRLLEADTSWQLPEGIYTEPLTNLFREVKLERERREAAQCRADLNACRADLSEERAEHNALKAAYRELEGKYNEQEVEIVDRKARSRVFAFFPFGIGHFYTYGGDRSRRTDLALGISFLTAEAAFGITGLALLLNRTIRDGCRRTRAFQAGSLRCQADPGERDGLVARRQAEEVMAWAFLVTVVADIVVAQIRFKDFETLGTRTCTRKNLKECTERRPGGSRRKRRRDKKRRAKVSPAAPAIRAGAGLGIRVRW